jgi:diguanylate cyclase (GGDEF)-like protein
MDARRAGVRWAGGMLAALCALAAVAQEPRPSPTPAIVSIERLAPDLDPPPEAVVAGAHASQYEPAASTRMLVVRGSAPTWWRLTIARDARDAVLAIYNPYSAIVRVYLPPDYRERRASVYDPDLPATHSRRALAFALPHDFDATKPAYVRLSRARGYPLAVAALPTADFVASDLAHVRRVVATIAVLFAVGVVAGMFWLLLRERMYAGFCLYMLFQAAYLAAATGEAAALPVLSWLLRLGPESVSLTASIAAAIAIHFLRDFGELRRYAPRTSRVLGWFGVALWLIAALLLLPLPLDFRVLPSLGNLVLLGANATALVALAIAVAAGGRAARFVAVAWVPLVVLSTLRAVQINAGWEFWTWLEVAFPLSMAYAALVLTLGVADRMLAFRRERDRAQREAETDPLTGVLNRKATTRRLERAFDGVRARGRDASFAVLFLDLDNFKRINDTLGHAVGDACLKAVVDNAHRELRQADTLGRWGGEEFLVVLDGAYATHATAVAERIRGNVEFRCREVEGQPVRLTVSIGVAEVTPADRNASAVVARADRALYEAKRRGRNRVVVYDATIPAASSSNEAA